MQLSHVAYSMACEARHDQPSDHTETKAIDALLSQVCIHAFHH